MSQTNVIITSGSKNQIIHVPVVTSTTRSSTPIEKVTSTSSSLTINRNSPNISSNKTNISLNHSSGDNNTTIYLPSNKSNKTLSSTVSRNSDNNKNYTNVSLNNREIFSNSDDNCEIKTIYYKSGENYSREHLLLPTDGVVIKEEDIGDDEYEDYDGMDISQLEDMGNSKTQYVCAGCGKGFCYIGWLDRHKLASPECLNAETIQENYPNNKESNVTTNYLSMCGGTTVEMNSNVEKRQSTKPTDSSKVDKFRPSLEGRLNELLCCPNNNCGFTTHWVQSLNKHVFTSCKFSGRDGVSDISSQNTVSSSNKTSLTCQVCSKTFNDSEEHIQHMKTSHSIKLIYQCSECGLSFANKYQSEAHIVEHNRMGKHSATDKVVLKPMNSSGSKSTVNTEENEVIDGTAQQVWHCKCGKNYLSLRSYEIHCTSCENALQSMLKSPQNKPPVLEQQQKTSKIRNSSAIYESESSRSPFKSFRHFKREQIEAIHTDDFICKYCTRELASSYGLCNHLSRRPMCREWYYKNLAVELQKNNSSHLMERERSSKRARYEMNSFNSSDRHSNLVNKHSTDESSIGTMTRPRRASIIARNANSGVKSQDTDTSYDSPPIASKNSVSCKRCHKVFVGKNPNVALTNHLRGSTCNPNKQTLTQKQQIFHSRQRQYSSSPVSVVSNNINTNRFHGESRFYCKLCPRIELKNRVSLGCHLTIYHGLPQVNVTTSEGDAYRCQTCTQVFISKYFYNLHRHDCDLTSPYVGVVSEGEELSNARPFGRTNSQNNYQKHENISKTNSHNIFKSRRGSQDEDKSRSLKCSLCGKLGFGNLNAIKIHQKYQCVRRFQVNQNNRTHSNTKRFSNQSKLKPLYNSMRRQKHVGPGGKVYMSELAKLNDMAKSDTKLTMCDSCGRGPYNSYYYFLEHKKKFCVALKGKVALESTVAASVSRMASTATKSINMRNIRNTAKKTVNNDKSFGINESFCLSPTIPRARKTMAYANVSSPQVSHDSDSPQIDYTDADNNQDAIDVSEIIKCSICFDEFDDILQFIRHRLSHITTDIMHNEPAEPLKCELCDAQVVHYQRIQQHLILHLQNVQIMKKRSLIEVNKKPHDWRNTHEESDEEEETDDPVLHCPYCKSEYKSRVELADHIKNTCPFRYQCANCNNTYSAKESYLEHKDECTKNTAISKTALKTPSFKCRNCGLEFRIKQQLLWHEHACNKVYTADHSGRVEEVIERTLSCSVCGLISNVYESKVKHETKCLKRYLAVIGNSTEEIDSIPEEISKPLSVMDFDLRSLSNSSQSSGIPEELIKNLKDEFGIQKEVKVVLTAFDEDIVRRVKDELYSTERDETNQLESLKESFLTLVRRLIKDDEVLQGISEESSAEILLSRMLKYLGEEAIEANGLNELSCFRQNLQTFLKLTIKDDTLILAYKDAESVDEAIINMLNFECELHY